MFDFTPQFQLTQPIQLTPVVRHGDYLVKRDDLWDECGVARGGKSRTAGIICRYAKSKGFDGIAVGVSRNTSVPDMLSRVAKHNGLRLVVHASSGELPEIFERAASHGAKVVQHKPGYMSVIRSRLMEECSKDKGLLPLGLGLGLPECDEILTATASQVWNILRESRRVVMVVGSGWMFQGVMRGLSTIENPPKLIGVCVGAPPEIQLKSFCKFEKSVLDFMENVHVSLPDLPLDPTYEAKCWAFLEHGDLLWNVCHRDTE